MALRSSYQEVAKENTRLTDDGASDVFDHFDHDELTGPPISPTIYASAIISTLGCSAEDLNSWSIRSIMITWPAWLFVIFNVIASLIIIDNVRQIRDLTPQCEADFELLILSVVIFNTYNVGDIFETIDMALWISAFPTVETYQQLTFGTAGDEKEVVSGMTNNFKIISYLTIVLPKLIIGLLLAYFGSGFLLVSDDNETIILNSMALTFITQIDDFVYVAMCPANIKAALDDFPPFKITYGRKMLGFARPVMVSVFITIIAVFSYHNTCGNPDAAPTHMRG